MTPFSTVFQIYRGGQCTYPCFPGVLLTSNPHHILPKPLAAFPHNHCRNNGQRRERNESCRNDYYQSPERIFAKPGIEPTRTCSQVPYQLWGLGFYHRIESCILIILYTKSLYDIYIQPSWNKIVNVFYKMLQI